MRAARSSRLLSVAAVLALIVVASLAVIVIDSSPMVYPLQRIFERPASAPLPKDGTLVVRMLSNQDFSSVVAKPLSAPAPVARWPLTIVTINSSVISVTPIPLTTDSDGVATMSLLPGTYILGAPYNTLDISVLFQVYSNSTTSVQLVVSESSYPVLFSEVGDVAGQAVAYVELGASAPAAGVGDLVTIGAETAAGAYQAKASVASQWPPVDGTEWLKVEPQGIFDIASASSAVLATWSYSSTVTVAPTSSVAPINE